MRIKCYHPDCNKYSTHHTMYRVNEKGKPGIFACEDHRNPEDPDFLNFIKLLEKANDPNSSKPQHS